jgi:DNA-binding MarR family transcriptional regulator
MGMGTIELTVREAEVWATYQRMRVRLTGRLQRELARTAGLSEADYDILMALVAWPNETVRAMALRCGLEWEKSRLSHQLSRMAARGLITREECAEDSRGAVVRITEKGRVLAEEARRVCEQTVHRSLMGALTPDQLDALRAIAEAVLARLDEDGT